MTGMADARDLDKTLNAIIQNAVESIQRDKAVEKRKSELCRRPFRFKDNLPLDLRIKKKPSFSDTDGCDFPLDLSLRKEVHEICEDPNSAEENHNVLEPAVDQAENIMSPQPQLDDHVSSPEKLLDPNFFTSSLINSFQIQDFSFDSFLEKSHGFDSCGMPSTMEINKVDVPCPALQSFRDSLPSVMPSSIRHHDVLMYDADCTTTFPADTEHYTSPISDSNKHGQDVYFGDKTYDILSIPSMEKICLQRNEYVCVGCSEDFDSEADLEQHFMCCSLLQPDETFEQESSVGHLSFAAESPYRMLEKSESLVEDEKRLEDNIEISGEMENSMEDMDLNLMNKAFDDPIESKSSAYNIKTESLFQQNDCDGSGKNQGRVFPNLLNPLINYADIMKHTQANEVKRMPSRLSLVDPKCGSQTLSQVHSGQGYKHQINLNQMMNPKYGNLHPITEVQENLNLMNKKNQNPELNLDTGNQMNPNPFPINMDQMVANTMNDYQQKTVPMNQDAAPNPDDQKPANLNKNPTNAIDLTNVNCTEARPNSVPLSRCIVEALDSGPLNLNAMDESSQNQKNEDDSASGVMDLSMGNKPCIVTIPSSASISDEAWNLRGSQRTSLQEHLGVTRSTHCLPPNTGVVNLTSPCRIPPNEVISISSPDHVRESNVVGVGYRMPASEVRNLDESGGCEANLGVVQKSGARVYPPKTNYYDGKYLMGKYYSVPASNTGSYEEVVNLSAASMQIDKAKKMRPIKPAEGHAKKQRSKQKVPSPLKVDFKCNWCDKTFQKLFRARRHEKMVHFKERPYICPLCAKAFAQSSDLRKHQVSIHKMSLCTLCHQVFSDTNALMIHQSLAHPWCLEEPKNSSCSNKPDMAEVGQHTTETTQPLSSTSSVHNPDAAPPGVLRNEDGNVVYQSVMGESRLQCPQCPRKVKSRSELKKHQLSHRSDVRMYSCAICDKHFKRMSNLRQHEATFLHLTNVAKLQKRY